MLDFPLPLVANASSSLVLQLETLPESDQVVDPVPKNHIR
jgi:hypothetical protein